MIELGPEKLTIFIESKNGSINSYPVMEKWEEPYMNKFAQIVCSTINSNDGINGCKILEIGYGMGISAKYIDKYISEKDFIGDKHEHIIIECNEELFDNSLLYANSHKNIIKHNIIPIYGFYENITKNFEKESFDGILFDAILLKR
jgi:hypothetical protein